MESDDEFNQFVMNELIDASSDDENDPFFGAAHMIIEDSVNHPGRIGSIEGHDVLDRERVLYHGLLYKKTISQIILHSERRLLDAGSSVGYLCIFFYVTYTIFC